MLALCANSADGYRGRIIVVMGAKVDLVAFLAAHNFRRQARDAYDDRVQATCAGLNAVRAAVLLLPFNLCLLYCPFSHT